MIVLILKLLVILAFLVMFLRRPSVTWGVGLLTVTSAILLDTFLGTFNRDEMLEQFGFFYYFVAGSLFAGAAFWLWGVLRPYAPSGVADTTAFAKPQQATAAAVAATSRKTTPVSSATVPVIARAKTQTVHTTATVNDAEDAFTAAGYDRLMLHEQIIGRFGPEDLADLVFDLNLNEVDVMTPDARIEVIANNILDAAEREDKVAALALSIERILTPPPAEHLPRLEKLTVDSPRPVWRYYLLANNDLPQLHELAGAIDVDWEQLPQTSKRTVARELLYYVYRRGRLADLLAEMKQMAPSEPS